LTRISPSFGKDDAEVGGFMFIIWAVDIRLSILIFSKREYY